MTRNLLVLLCFGGLVGCAASYAPITKSTLAKAPTTDVSQLAAIATRDHGLQVRAIDGRPVETAVAYIEPGQHLLEIELTRAYAIVLGSGPVARTKLIAVQLQAEAGHSYAILGITDEQLDSVAIFADDKGESYDVECFFWHRLELPAQHFGHCPDRVAENGILLPPRDRLSEKSIPLPVALKQQP